MQHRVSGERKSVFLYRRQGAATGPTTRVEGNHFAVGPEHLAQPVVGKVVMCTGV
jgi:hypothetical protein